MSKAKTTKNQDPLLTMADLNAEKEEKNFMDDNAPEEEEESDESEEEEEESENEESEEEEEVPQPKPAAKKVAPKKSEVRVHREDGKYKKSVPIQLQGLTSMMLPPITKRRVAQYQVIGKDQIDPLTDKIIEPTPPLIIPASYVIYDPFEEDILKRHKTLKNVTRFENKIIGGVNVPHEVIEDIIFNDGFKIIPIERNYLEYVLLELHPLNASNRWRPRDTAPAFKRVDIEQRKWAQTGTGMNLAYEAETAVINLRKPDDIMALAHAAGIQTAGRILDNDREGCVKYDLRVFARNDPKGFFKLNKGVEQAVRVSVLDAEELGLIEYNIDNRTWKFSTDGEHICVHLPGEDPIKSLIKMFQKPEYRDKYKVLQNQLNYWD